MELKKEAAEIQKAIQSYAPAYKALEEWQRKSQLIPIGDQKTGCIGEFYVYLYITHRFPKYSLTYGSHSEKGWDLKVYTEGLPTFKVQVKTVSEYSTSRVISPIHYGWDELHIVYLSREFNPKGFWIIRDPTIIGRSTTPLKGKRCPKPEQAGTGSKDIIFGDNLIDDLQESISEFLDGDTPTNLLDTVR